MMKNKIRMKCICGRGGLQDSVKHFTEQLGENVYEQEGAWEGN